MPRKQWFRVLPFGALLLMLITAAARGQDAPPTETRCFALPPGTLSAYEVKVFDRPGAEPMEVFRVTACRPGADAGGDVALLFTASGETEAIDTNSPLVFVKLLKSGKLVSDRRGDVPPARSFLIGMLFPSVEGPAIRPGARWTQAEVSPFPYLPMEVQVQHGVDRAGEGKLEIRSRTTREKEVTTLGFTFNLLGWKREIVLDDATSRPLSGQAELHFRTGSVGEELDERYQIVRVRELEHRNLTTDEVAALPDEIAKLREVDDINQGRTGGAGGLLSLFTGPQKRREPQEALTLLDAYEKTHADGLLAGAVEPWRKKAASRLDYEKKRKEEEAQIARLIGSQAPDFTLQDLEGKNVSLSDYRGKLVLLAFWGYG